jgi:hypothetical protein
MSGKSRAVARLFRYFCPACSRSPLAAAIRALEWLSMRALLLLLTCVALHAVDNGVFDMPVRYVNDDVITLREVIDRVQQERSERSRQKKSIPVTRDQMLALSASMLEELTDDKLLLQYSQTIGVRIDGDFIKRTELERARSEGRNLSVFDQSRRRQAIERRERINAALSYFDFRTAFITPTTLLSVYHERMDKFRRPPRVKVFQIWMRPSDDKDRQAVRQAKLDLFKQAQASTDPAVAKSAEDRLAPYIDASDEKKQQLLDELVASLIALDDKGGLQGDGQKVVSQAKLVRDRQAQLKSLEQVTAELDALRATLVGKGVDAFKAAARVKSQGPRKDDGGVG